MEDIFRNEGPPRVVHLRVDPEEDGRRLDNYLMARLRGLPRARVYRLIRGGEVRVNGGRAGAATRLKAGDDVRVPPVRDLRRQPAPVREDRLDWIRRLVIGQDQDLLVLAKPAGLAVHGGSGVSLGAIELLRAALPDGDRLELVHRLDRDTSGCLLVARRRSMLRRLHEAFRAGEISKRYLALLVGGNWPGGALTSTAPLLTSERRGGERHVRIDEQGKPAETRFYPLRRYPAAVLAGVDLRSGRTHQIRVHAAGLGHPVAGDPRYGAGTDPVVEHAGLRRLFLHAGALGFRHPRSGEWCAFRCPLPPDLAQVLERLEY